MFSLLYFVMILLHYLQSKSTALGKIKKQIVCVFIKVCANSKLHWDILLSNINVC